jgi:diacylglycerol kinase family enzyme
MRDVISELLRFNQQTRVPKLLHTVGACLAWDQLRSSGRDGSASADAMIAHGGARGWQRPPARARVPMRGPDGAQLRAVLARARPAASIDECPRRAGVYLPIEMLNAEPQAAGQGPYFVVLNPRSGASRKHDVPAVLERAFRAAGRQHQLIPIGQRVDDAAKRAAELAQREQGVIVAAGGDGTIRCVATQALRVRRPLGILPQGTFNITGRTWGIPLQLDAAVEALLRSRVRRVQVGLVNDHVFLVNASLGLYPELLEEREQFKRQFGRRRAVGMVAALVTLMRHHRHLVLQSEHDEGRELLEAATLFVGNNAMQLEDVGLPESEDVQHGKLAAVFVKPVGRLHRLRLFARGLAGKLAGDSALHDFPFEQLTVRPRRSHKPTLKVALDGEIMRLPPPLEFSVAKQPLLLLTPAGG